MAVKVSLMPSAWKKVYRKHSGSVCFGICGKENSTKNEVEYEVKQSRLF